MAKRDKTSKKRKLDEETRGQLLKEISDLGGHASDVDLFSDSGSESGVEFGETPVDKNVQRELETILKSSGRSSGSIVEDSDVEQPQKKFKEEKVDDGNKADKSSKKDKAAREKPSKEPKDKTSKESKDKTSKESKDKVNSTKDLDLEQDIRRIIKTGEEEPEFKIKSGWLIEPETKWHEVGLMDFENNGPVNADQRDALRAYAQELWDGQVHMYNEGLRANGSVRLPGISASDVALIENILVQGTMSDRISTNILLMTSAPIHARRFFNEILSGIRKQSRDVMIKYVSAVVTWWSGDGVPARKLVKFDDRPSLQGATLVHSRLDQLPQSLQVQFKQTMVVWIFEDFLKGWFFSLLQSLEGMSNDTLQHTRILSISHMFTLIVEKPEQEANLLRMIVHKLGDRSKNVASKASYTLLQILQHHPFMGSIVAREVAADILRPMTQPHERYYGIITLNQIVLKGSQVELAQRLVSIYFSLFDAIMSADSKEAIPKDKGSKKQQPKKKQRVDPESSVLYSNSRLIAGILTGINRAFPYAKLSPEALGEHLQVLFRISHTGTFNVAIQALSLIFRFSELSSVHIEDRVFRVLYESLLDPRLVHTNKQNMYLNLLFKAGRRDSKAHRVRAMIKRLLQVALHMSEPSFIAGALWVTAEVLKAHASLAAGLGGSSIEDGQFYDPWKRDPQYAHAGKEPLWELTFLASHFHPVLEEATQQIILDESVDALKTTNLDQFSLAHLMDRFVYREPRKEAPLKGSSLMQPSLAAVDENAYLFSTRSTENEIPANSQKFLALDISRVPSDMLFFYKYFKSKEDTKPKKEVAESETSDVSDVDIADDVEEDDDDDLSLSDMGKDDSLAIEKDSDEASEPASDAGSVEEEGEAVHADDNLAVDDWDTFGLTMGGDDQSEGVNSEDVSSEESDDSESIPDDESVSDEGSADGQIESEGSDSEGDENEDSEDEDSEDDDSESFDELAGIEDDEDDVVSSDDEAPKGKKRLKDLPVFASAEDYAHLLNN